MHWLDHVVRHALLTWGYWAVLAGLLGENAGVPLPGETVLMFASFLAHKSPQLQLVWVIVIGTAAAITGDNLGFLLGRKLGSRLTRWMKKIFHLEDEDIGAAKDQIRRHGGATIFWARYNLWSAHHCRAAGGGLGNGVEEVHSVQCSWSSHLGHRNRVDWLCLCRRVRYLNGLFRKGLVDHGSRAFRHRLLSLEAAKEEVRAAPPL